MGVDIRSYNVDFKCVSTDKSSSCRTNSNPAGTVATPTSVKRCLFGVVDQAECNSFFQKEFARHEEEKKIMWNFDFRNDKPLKGAFKWEKVDRSTSTATCKLLRSPSKVTKTKGKRSPLKPKVNVDVNVKTKQTQSSITDYLDKTKSIVKQPRAVNK